MRVLKVVLDGITTSFRYPHFLVGRHPSLPMPPPSTVYGHICSAFGSFVDPSDLYFAYSFSYAGVGDDVEHLQIIQKVVTRKHVRRGTRSRRVRTNGEAVPANVIIQVGPVSRELLLFPHLELYVAANSERLLERLRQAFSSPAYPVVLGRSQDLCSYRLIELVELERSTDAYFEDALLPWEYRMRTTAGFMVRMPRFIDPTDRRRVIWGDYLVLTGRALLEEGPPGPTRVAVQKGKLEWVDPTTPPVRGRRRAVVWHSFVQEQE